MELSFSELRAKEVVNTQDGKKLGKVSDVVLRYPENKWYGIVVPGCRGFGFRKTELFIDLKHIIKIGEDVILVNVGFPRKQKNDKGRTECCPPPSPPSYENGNFNRNYDEFE